jgi:hypothetical protein
MLQPTPVSRSRRRPSLGLVIMVIALFLSFPAGIIAAHQFSDVPNSHTFHSNIANLYNARITTGCGTGIYCPDLAVSRGQMAGFLNRGFGRATVDSGSITIDGDGGGVVATVSIHTGGASGGTGFVVLAGSGTMRVMGDGICPCTFGLGLENTAARNFNYETVPDIDSPYGVFFANTKWASASDNFVVQVNSNTDYTFTLRYDLDVTAESTDDITIWGYITAVYVPFGYAGGDDLAPLIVETVPADQVAP